MNKNVYITYHFYRGFVFMDKVFEKIEDAKEYCSEMEKQDKDSGERAKRRYNFDSIPFVNNQNKEVSK